jgi:hypothetical protein
MRARMLERWVGRAAILVLLLAFVYGCPGDTELATGASEGSGSSGSGGGDAGGSGNDGDSGTSGGGSGSSGGGAGRGGSGSGSGTAGSGSSGTNGGGDAGSGSGGDDGTCAPGTAIPLICQLCPEDTCGEPVCKGGQFTGEFRCPDGGVGGTGSAGTGGGDSDGCVHGGCSSHLCGEASDGPIVSTCEWRDEYACYQAAECARQADGQCGFTETNELTDCLAGGGAGGGLQWYATCGDPVCSDQQEQDDPAVPNCGAAMAEGSACTDEGARCETRSCGVDHVCAATDPIGNFGCPISRARYKRDVDYVDEAQLSRLHDEVTHLPLATWEYKHAPGVPQLGFIIEDIEPSAAATGDHVNVYGYLSMAVAAIQVQQRQIEALRAELSELREGQLDPAALVCAP